MKYFIGTIAVILTVTSCSLFTKGACESKWEDDVYPYQWYECRDIVEAKCNPEGESFEVYFHEGLSCNDIGYTYLFNDVVWYTDEVTSTTPGSEGHWADDAGGGGGASYCTDSYEGPTDDIQRDSYCQAAYAYLCIEVLSPDSEEVSSNCEIYNSSSWGYTGNCPYCP